MKKTSLSLALCFACCLPLSAQTTPFKDEKSVTPGTGLIPATISGNASSSLDLHSLPDISLPVKSNRGTVLLKGPDAWKHLALKQPMLFALIQKLVQASRSLKAESPHAKLFAGLQGIQINEGSTVFAFPGDRFLVLDGDSLDRMTWFSYDRLTPDEKRILDKSKIEGCLGKDGKPLTGPALFADLATKNPRALLAFTNLCARLRSPSFVFPFKGETRSALQFIGGLTYQECDRFRAECDPSLATLVGISKRFSKAPGHGEHFPNSFKQNDVTSGGGQFCFSPNGTAVEFDIDMYNISAKNPFKKIAGALGHAAEVLTPGKTDPFKVYEQLKGQKIVGSALVGTFPEGFPLAE